MFDVDKIPANEWLPGEVHSLADEFRANEERLAAFSAKRAELSHAIHTAKLEDAGALKAAVLAGKDTPPETNRQKAEAALAEHMRREPVLRGERARLVAALTQALRGDNRDKVAEIIQAKAAPAVTEYVAAVREATAKIAEAYQAVGKCQPALDLIRVLDAGETQLRVPAPAALSAGPVETFAARVADLHTRPDFDPTQQRVVVDAETGETYTAAADLIAVWLAEGKTLRIVDGWPVPGIQPNRITLSARGSDAVPGRLLGPDDE
ncbi:MULTISPECIES: hypothetical protein [unclassified Amycolatopsis]|uniref:hypothetical protein n=1 Tax=unclassified Amycolatopsis TaxID=2618356 RepID=UPI00106F0405|nr:MULTISPECIES: hypothetical protein [unclassified Amycolatopsis]